MSERPASDAEAEAMMRALAEFYGEPVRRVSDYCGAFFDWFDACAKAGQDFDNLSEDERGWRSPPPLYGYDKGKLRHLDILKSNYLFRRIYMGERHRTEPCPVHKGRWSGCTPNDPGCGCWLPNGMGDVTGWLPASTEATSSPAPGTAADYREEQ